MKNLSKFNANFRLNLRNAEVILGTGITNGQQLDSLAQYMFGTKYKGLYVKHDKLPRLKQGECCIINAPENIHWVGSANIGGTVYEYDSFGRDMLGSRFKDFNKIGDGIPDQRLEREHCGARVIAWLATVLS